MLFGEGDEGDQLFVIAEGKLKLAQASSDGRENVLSVLGPGEMFGELSLFDPGPCTATARTLTDARLLALSNPDLRPWLDRRPEVSVSLLRQISRRLRRAHGFGGDLVFCDGSGRASKALLDLAAEFGRPGPDGLYVDQGLTQGELAQLVGGVPGDGEPGAGRLHRPRLAAAPGPVAHSPNATRTSSDVVANDETGRQAAS